MDIAPTDLPACASQDGAHSSLSLTADAGAQTETPVVQFIAADWPHMSMLPGSSALYSVPGTADLMVDGRTVTVGLCIDHGDTDLPYVAGEPEWLTIAQSERVNAAVLVAWDAHEQLAREAA